MEKVNSKENKLVFKAKIEDSLMNAVRRYVFQVPVLSIDEVEISRNDSALYDETIAHRLGLIPIEKKGNKKELKLKLSVKKEGIVYSKELTGDTKAVYGEIPITTLQKGQELDLVATAIYGKGVEHSKFNPGIIFYREVASVKPAKDCPSEIASTCPQNILINKDGKIEVETPLACDMCGECLSFSESQKKEYITIEPTDELLITVESFGQISPEDIFTNSIDALKKDLAEVTKKI